MSDAKNRELLKLTSEIVAAYLSRNDAAPKDIPGLIQTVHEALSGLEPASSSEALPAADPAVAVEDSVTDEFIYSLEDGQPYKSLKRHLKAKYNMSPEDYRQKWNLPPDYPMVAPAYARERSELAKKSGLGRNRPSPY